MALYIFVVAIVLFSSIMVAKCNLDVMVSGNEMKNLFLGSDDDIRLMDNGIESDLLRNFTTYFPPIQADLFEFNFKLASTQGLYYHIHLSTSDTKIMHKPTMTSPYTGQLHGDYKVFKIYFPCTKQKTGVVNLGIVVDFYYDSGHMRKYKTVNLSLKRYCKADHFVNDFKNGCKKDCSLNNFRRKYCLADFVARIKVLKATATHYIVRVPTKRIFKHPCSVQMDKKTQLLKIRSTTITCNCKPLEEGKRYLLFAREDFIDKELFVDSYSLAYEIPKHDNKANKLMRDFRQSYRSTRCPSPTVYEYYCRRNKWS